MELYKQLFVELLKNERAKAEFLNLLVNVSDGLELECYKTLQKIKTIIEDERLNDRECFIKIEEIISTFEKLGIGSKRHDFG